MKFIVDTLNIEALEGNASQTIMLHGGAGRASIGHLRFWIPLFERTEVDFVILTRDIVVYTSLIEEFPLFSIVYAKNPLDVEEVINKLESLNAVFYTSNVGKNIHLLRFNHIKHIHIGSENSDRLSKITKFYRAYDEIYISGEGMRDKFKSEDIKLGHLKFTRVGKPHLKYLFEQKSVSNKSFKLSYTPSWEGKNETTNLSSLSLLSKILYEIRNFNLSLSLKLHSKTGKRDKSLSLLNEKIEEVATYLDMRIDQYRYIDNLKSEDEREHEIEEDDFVLNSDAIICDLETLSFEHLALDTPIFVYTPISKNIERFLERGYEQYAYTFSTIDELSIKLKNIIEGKDELKESRKEAMEYWLGREETMSNRFLQQLKEYV